MIIIILILIGMAIVLSTGFFDNVKDESVEKAQEVKITFQLPKLDDQPVEYIIDGVPYEIDTPESPYNKKAWKLPVKNMGIDGEIFVNDSLIFQIAVAMKKLDIKYSEKNFSKIIGYKMTIWMSKSVTSDNKYYNCQIVENSEIGE